MIKVVKNNVKCQGHLKGKVIMLKKLLEENKTLCKLLTTPNALLQQSISRKKNPHQNYIHAHPQV